VDAVSFKVPAQKITGLVGQNGVGKTTTLKMIVGALSSDSGEVIVGGLSLSQHPKKIKEKIGYVPERSFLYPQKKVLSHLRWFGEMRGLERAVLQERLTYVVRVCRLQEVLSQKIKTLSKGFQQRVALAQALLHDPEILILDEPTEGLDPAQISEIRGTLKELSQTKTILFSSHILSEVMKLCENIIVLKQGRIVYQGLLKNYAQTENEFEKKFLESV
jgi:ABC-2 type transport system ATP-binding protein